MISLGISNIRRLKMDSSIDFKPINIIVGRNSSGKSTYLRSIPLIRQSILTRSSAPILWYGDLVDFGDYKTAVHDHDPSKSINFRFGRSEFSVDRRLFTMGRVRNTSENADIKIDAFSVDYEVAGRAVSAAKTQTVLKAVTYTLTGVGGGELCIDLGDDGQKVIDVRLDGDSIRSLLNISNFRAQKSLFSSVIFGAAMDSPDIKGFFQTEITHILAGILFNSLRERFDRRLKPENIYNFLMRLVLSVPNTDAKIRGAAQQMGVPRIVKYVDNILGNPESEDIKLIRKICKIYYIIKIAEYSVLKMRDTFSQSTYIGPVRARSNRFYRMQELSVSDIDPDGTNLPMFLSSLTRPQMDSFSTFVQKTFGFGVQIENFEGHLSLFLKYPHDRSNIVDSGFGVSQLLPVLAQLWWCSTPARASRSRLQNPTKVPVLIAMEQPELHLHPAHQALLADVFLETLSIAGENRNISIIAETHSSEIINRIGVLIEDEKISASDVQILIYDDDDGVLGGVGERGSRSNQDHVTERSQVSPRVVYFNELGVLEKWPAGFFISDLR